MLRNSFLWWLRRLLLKLSHFSQEITNLLINYQFKCNKTKWCFKVSLESYKSSLKPQLKTNKSSKMKLKECVHSRIHFKTTWIPNKSSFPRFWCSVSNKFKATLSKSKRHKCSSQVNLVINCYSSTRTKWISLLIIWSSKAHFSSKESVSSSTLESKTKSKWSLIMNSSFNLCARLKTQKTNSLGSKLTSTRH